MIDKSQPLEPLSPQVFAILLALGDESRHGYGILKEVEERTAGQVALLPGSLYSALRRMLDSGWIEEVEAAKEDDDPRRRYYALTPAGRQRALEETRRMSTLLRVAEEKKLTPAPLRPLPEES